MSAALDKAGKAAASTFPNVVPILIYGGIGYLFYRILKAQASELSKGLGGVERAELVSQAQLEGAVTSGLTASILEPAKDGVAATEGLLREEYPVKFVINNPDAARGAFLRYEVDEFPPWPFSKTTAVWNQAVQLKAGKNLFEVKVPKTATNLQGYTKAVAKLLIDGQQYASTNYTIE